MTKDEAMARIKAIRLGKYPWVRTEKNANRRVKPWLALVNFLCDDGEILEIRKFYYRRRKDALTALVEEIEGRFNK